MEHTNQQGGEEATSQELQVLKGGPTKLSFERRSCQRPGKAEPLVGWEADRNQQQQQQRRQQAHPAHHLTSSPLVQVGHPSESSQQQRQQQEHPAHHLTSSPLVQLSSCTGGAWGRWGESPVLTQSKAEPVIFFPESLIFRALHSFYARMEALVAKFTGRVMGWQVREEATRDLPNFELFKQLDYKFL